MSSPWQVLGIEPTDNTSVIKRAYAVRLKAARPDEDPESFQRLRAAYDTVLRIASLQAVQPVPEPPILPETPPNQHGQARPAPSAIGSTVDGTKQPTDTLQSVPEEIQLEIQALRTAFASGDGETAVNAMEIALGLQTLPIDVEIQAKNALIGILLKDEKIPAPRLLEIAKHFGWYGVPDSLRGPNGAMERQFCLRIDAALWLAALKRRARSWKFWFGENEAVAARLILGSAPITLSWITSPQSQLSNRVAEAFIYAPLLNGTFKTKRLERLSQILAWSRKIWSQYPTIFRVTWISGIVTFYFKSFIPEYIPVILLLLSILLIAERFIGKYYRPLILLFWLTVCWCTVTAVTFNRL